MTSRGQQSHRKEQVSEAKEEMTTKRKKKTREDVKESNSHIAIGGISEYFIPTLSYGQ